MNKEQDKSFIDRYFWRGLAVVLVVGGLANLLIWFWPRTPEAIEVTLPSYSVEQVALGEQVYQANCSSCHAADLSGYAAVSAPALDASEHAWHHSDQQIRSWIRNGLGRMPAAGTGLTGEEVDALLAYIKQSWEPEQLARQTLNSRQAN